MALRRSTGNRDNSSNVLLAFFDKFPACYGSQSQIDDQFSTSSRVSNKVYCVSVVVPVFNKAPAADSCLLLRLKL